MMRISGGMTAEHAEEGRRALRWKKSRKKLARYEVGEGVPLNVGIRRSG
jgi:hypothetical protein